MNARTLRPAAVAAFLLALPLLAGCPKTTKTEGAAAGPRPQLAHAAVPVMLPEADNPVVAIRLAFRTGSVDDPEGKEGLTALTAAVMSEGGTKKLSSAELIRTLYPMAAQLSVQVDREMTVFYGRCHRDHLAQFLPILADVVLEPRLDPKEFERLKTDALNAVTLHLRTADDEELGKEALETMLAPEHPYGHPPVGTESGLKAITMEDVLAHRKKVFGQARLIVGMAGGYDGKSTGAFQARMSALPMGAPATKPPEPPVAKEQAFLIVEKPTRGTAASLGFNTEVKRGHPDFHKLRLAMAYFGEHRQQIGVLFNEIREERGLNYGTYAYAEEFVQEGWGRFIRTNIPRTHQHFEMWLRPVETKNAVFALRGTLWAFRNLVENGLTREEFESTRDYMIGYSRLWEQTTDRRLGYAIDNVFYGTPEYLDAFRQAMQSMTVEQVNGALKEHLGGRALQVAIVTADGAAMKELLVSGKPTPPDYGKPGEAPPKPPEVRKEDEAIATTPIGATPERVTIVPASEMFD